MLCLLLQINRSLTLSFRGDAYIKVAMAYAGRKFSEKKP